MHENRRRTYLFEGSHLVSYSIKVARDARFCGFEEQPFA